MTVGIKNISTKALFAVGVVAITAVVGSVGFASAHRGNFNAFNASNVSVDGYGGVGALIRAAVNQFQSDVSAAQARLTNDINDCITNNTNSSVGTRSDFTRRDRNATNDLRLAAASSNLASLTPAQINALLSNSEQRVSGRLGDSANTFYASLDRERANHNQNSLSRCIRQANQSFLNSVQNARQDLVRTLRSIIGRG